MQPGRVRARPVDNFKRLSILRRDEGVVYDEELIDSTSQVTKKSKVDLPVPAVSEVTDYGSFTPATFAPPDAYFRRHVPPEEIDGIEYDLDHEDELWLARHSRYGSGGDPGSQLARGTFERLLDLLERISGERNNGGAISQSDATTLIPPRLAGEPLPATAATGAGLTKLIEDVYSYWNMKRTKLKKPLLRRFWPLTAVMDKDPHHTFRPHERDRIKLRRTRKNDAESLDKASRLVTDLKSAREILDCVRAREELKSELTLVSRDWFEQCLHDATDTTGVPRVPTTLNRPRIADRIPKRSRAQGFALQRVAYEDVEDNGGAGGGVTDAEYAPSVKQKKDKRQATVKPPRQPGGGDAGGATGDKRPKPTGSGVKRPKVVAKVAVDGVAPAPPPVRPAVPVQMIYKEGHVSNNPHGHAHMFAHGYPGLKLGAWALPRTIPPNYLFDSYYDHEDPLGLGAALGLRTGIHTTPASVDAPSEEVHSFPVLPSKAGHFPYESAYSRPTDDDMYISDLTVQRSMLIQRASAGTVVAGANWEEGSGSGLVPGVGCNMAAEGRAWENAGAHTQSCILPVEDVCAAMDMDLALDKDAAAGQGAEATTPEHVSRTSDDDDWISRFVAACDVALPASTATPSPPQFMLRPRLGRCGRVVYDRLRVREHSHSAAVAHSLTARNAARQRARARAVASARTYSRDVSLGDAAALVNLPSRLELAEGVGMRVDATDAHAQHASAMGHYAGSGPDVFSSLRSHAAASDDVYSTTARLRGMHTAYLAQSKYAAAHMQEGEGDGEDAAALPASDALALTYADVTALCGDAMLDVAALCDGVLETVEDRVTGASGGVEALYRPKSHARGYDALAAASACVLHEAPLPVDDGRYMPMSQAQQVVVLRDPHGIPITGAHTDACVPSRVRVATAEGGDGHAPARAVGAYVQSLLGYGDAVVQPADIKKTISARVAARSCAVDDKRWETVWGAEDSDDEECVRAAYAAAVPRSMHADVGASVRAALAACVASALDDSQCAQLCASFAGDETVA